MVLCHGPKASSDFITLGICVKIRTLTNHVPLPLPKTLPEFKLLLPVAPLNLFGERVMNCKYHI